MDQCELCPTGFHRSGGDQKDGCNLCDSGKRCANGIQFDDCNCADCFSPEGIDTCYNCPDGYHPTSAKDSCEVCSTEAECGESCGTSEYWVVGGKCADRPDGYARSDGLHCPTTRDNGQFSNSGTNFNCQNCPQNEQCNEGTTVACTGPQFWSGEGDMFCRKCNRGQNCASCIANGACSDCAGTEYWENYECKSCDSGNVCDGENQYPCPSGMEVISNECERCDSNFDYDCSSNSDCQCFTCPVGYETAAGGTQCNMCGDNQYRSALNIRCQDCDANSYCPHRDGGPLSCPDGYYFDTGADTCRTCPEGNSCTGGVLGTCASDEYSYEGDSECRQCPPGHVCNGSGKQMCQYGQYVDSNVCTNCEVGSRCPTPDKAPQACSCTAGYCEYTDTTNAISCFVCPAGKRCTANSATDCASGEYSVHGERDCQTCPTDHYCQVTVEEPIPCHYGFYANTAQTECTICPEGRSCSKFGSVWSESVCGNDEYSPEGVYECISCPVGFDCSTSTKPIHCDLGFFSNNGICQECSAGKYCPIGAPSEIECPLGFYCEQGARVPTKCPLGRYGINVGQTGPVGCRACAGGEICDGIVKERCPRGHYCDNPAGRPTKCPVGTYNPDLGGNALGSCLTCPAGTYCSIGMTYDGDLCTAGYFCDGGDRTQCAAGTYSEREGNSVSTDCKSCTKGHFCPAGSSSPLPCPPGTYQNQENQQTCERCSSGFSCTTPGLIEPDLPCDHGHGCNQANYPNTWAPQISWQVFTGAEPIWTTVPATGCPDGTFSQSTNSGDVTTCAACPRGHYCFPKTGDGLINPLQCPAGYYCDGQNGILSTGNILRPDSGNTAFVGSTADGTRAPKQCLPGTWSNKTRLESPNDCWSCEKGWKCTFATNQLDKGDKTTINPTNLAIDETEHDKYFGKNYFRPFEAEL